MPPKKPKAARQSPLGFQQFTLIKKPLDVIGKQVNVLGAFWSGRMTATEKTTEYKCTTLNHE